VGSAVVAVVALGCGSSAKREPISDDSGARARSSASELPAVASESQSAPKAQTAERATVRGAGVVGAEGVLAFDALDDAAKARVRGARVFFGHQSVGANILSGATDLGFRSRSVARASDLAGPGWGEAEIAENHLPLKKVASFDALVVGQDLGARADVVGMKLCWVDFYEPEKTAGLTEAYAAEMDRIRAKYPETGIFHVTPPLATKEPKENADRVAFGKWLVATYGARDVVLDLQAVESTAPDGRACEVGGVPALCPAYAEDDGHLNREGSSRAARAFVVAIARSLGHGASK
jgi:hypothetical protein